VTVVRAARELLAAREDVWAFVAEPYHLADWWPGVTGVEPDRRGLAPGARWRLIAGPQAGGPLTAFLRPAQAAGTLLVLDVRAPERVHLQFVNDRIDAVLALAEAAPGRTLATLEVEGAWGRVNRALPRRALGRLHALVQTAADLGSPS
jgi:uncharacterized protein YndB with AHSA1/START domain